MSAQNKLQAIDRSLVELLGQRIQLLREHPELAASLLPGKQELEDSEVPEPLWKTLVTGCMAASLQPPKSSLPSSRQITLVGGHGVMGRFFGKRLEEAGHTIKILDAQDWENAESLLAGADLVLICVPLKSTVKIIQQIASYLSPTTVLADVASIKTPIYEVLMASHPGPVVSLHPMFGPGVTSLAGQKIVICHGRETKDYEWLLEWLEAEGGTLITCSPKEHDDMMVVVQAIRHFSTFCLGVFLAEEGVNVERSLEFATLVYRIQLGMIGRLFSQDMDLSIEIMLASQGSLTAINRLSNTFNRLANLIREQDRPGLIAEFEAAHSAFPLNNGKAMDESNYLIQSLSQFLAAERLQRISCHV